MEVDANGHSDGMIALWISLWNPFWEKFKAYSFFGGILLVVPFEVLKVCLTLSIFMLHIKIDYLSGTSFITRGFYL